MKKKYLIIFIPLFVFVLFSCSMNAGINDTDECLDSIEFRDYTEIDHTKWIEGFYTDTTTNINRGYSDNFYKYDLSSLDNSKNVLELYPRSYHELNCFYDSLTLSKGHRKLFFCRLDTLFVKYAIDDSTGCFQQLLNMTKFIDPRKNDMAWISELALDIYYYVIPENLQKFRHFYDTCNRSLYYGMSEWVESYNSKVLSR